MLIVTLTPTLTNPNPNCNSNPDTALMYASLIVIPVGASVMELCALMTLLCYMERGTWSIPCAITYPIFIVISLLVTGDSTVSLPIKHRHRNLQTLPLSANNPSVTTGASNQNMPGSNLIYTTWARFMPYVPLRYGSSMV